MRPPFCHAFLAFVLKFLNFLQAFVGVSIVVYSAYMLQQWQTQSVNFNAVRVSDGTGIAAVDFSSLPAPWFIYAFMGFGVLMCCVSFVGHIGAEAINGCCLCCYSLLITVLVLLEASLVAFIALDHHWEKDLPLDPTGELDSLRNFVQENADICKWIGIAVITIQALSLLLAVILRALANQKVDDDIEGDFNVRERVREPLLDPSLSQTPALAKGDTSAWHSDVWSSRMRLKYGLNRDDSSPSTPKQNP